MQPIKDPKPASHYFSLVLYGLKNAFLSLFENDSRPYLENTQVFLHGAWENFIRLVFLMEPEEEDF